MPSVLESVEWGKPALALLAQCNELNPDLPAVMHIRHSERLPPQSEDGIQIPLTEEGEKAAYEFGLNLPKGRAYRLYHSYVDRSRDTAVQIRRGISDSGGISQIADLIDLSVMLDVEKTLHYLRTDTKEDHVLNTSHSFFFRWVSGRYPPKELKPSLEFAQEGAALMMRNMESAGTDTLDIYVSHDVWIAAFLLHWFGVIPFKWIRFLNGFIVHFKDDRAVVFYRDKRLEVTLPYWWDFT